MCRLRALFLAILAIFSPGRASASEEAAAASIPDLNATWHQQEEEVGGGGGGGFRLEDMLERVVESYGGKGGKMAAVVAEIVKAVRGGEKSTVQSFMSFSHSRISA